MAGGPSQMDTWDMKPGHENGGEFKEIATNVAGLRFSEWLESLIDPAIKELQKHGDAELENIRLVRSARDAEGG